MKALPLELQTLIIHELDPQDIYSLQETCKHFNELIKNNLEIWRNCLRRQCDLDGLVWSSFEGFTTSREFEEACFGPVRFQQHYNGRWSNGKGVYLPPEEPAMKESGSPVPDDDDDSSDWESTSDASEHDYTWGIPSIKNPRPGIQSIFLVPGGRFLFTSQRSCLLLWDLQPIQESNSPSIIHRYPLNLDSFGYATTDILVDIVDERTLHVCLKIEMRRGGAENPIPEGSTGLKLQMLEVLLPCGEECSVSEIATLSAIGPSRIGSASDGFKHLFRDGVVGVYYFCAATLLWDYRRDEVVVWEILGTKRVLGVFVYQDHVFYLEPDGLRGIAVSDTPMKPTNGQRIDMFQRSLPQVSTSLFIPHEQQYKPKGFIDIMVSGPTYRSPSAPFIFELVEDNCVHRYELTFDQEAPAKPTTKRTEIIKAWEIDAIICRFSCGRVAAGYIWERSPEIGGVVLLIYPPPRNSPFYGVDQDVSEEESSHGGPMELLYEFQDFLSGPKESDLLGAISICPVSGRVVVMWDRRMEEDTFVEIFDTFKK